jgi:hypothetical protein
MSSKARCSKARYRPNDPFYTAELLIAQKGENAESYALMEMRDFQTVGDGDCYLAWGRICDAVVDLRSRTHDDVPSLAAGGRRDRTP